MQRKTIIFNIGAENFQLDLESCEENVRGIDCHTCWHLYRPEDTDFYGPLNHFIIETDVNYTEYLGKKAARKDSIREFIVLDDTSELSMIERVAISTAIKIIKN